MLLIDGVRYELWTPQKEVEEFHPIIKEHYREIFSKSSIFIEGNRLESQSGKGSVPDGFVVILNAMPEWHIVEMELSTHPLYNHVVNQVGRFINGVKNTTTQKKIAEAIYHYIQENKQLKAEVEEAISSGEIFKFVADVVSKPPVLTIIIERRTRELDEALDILRYYPIKIVEFQTFRREGAETVHAHLFEPLHTTAISTISEQPKQEIYAGSLRIGVWRSYIDYGYIGIWKKYTHLFPKTGNIEIISDETEIIIAQVGEYQGSKQIWNLQKWFKKHPELKEGDIICITPVVPKKKYRLEITN